MRVLYVITAAEFGGPSRHVLWLMEHLVKQGAQVGLVAAPEPRLLSRAQQLGAQVFPNPYFVRRVQLYNDLRALGPVFRAIRAFRPDLVSAHSTKAGYAARPCCAILGVRPVVFTAQGWPFSRGGRRLNLWASALAERLAALPTAKVICVCEHDLQLALKFNTASRNKLVVIYNGIDPEPFALANGAKVREEFGLGALPTIAMVGRLVPQKDPITLLKACSLLDKPFRLLLVGDGELRPQVEAFVAAQPRLRGSVLVTGERQDIPDILAASNLFALSSRWEGLPRAVIEAMMAGLPVVATRVGGTAELVDDGVTGFLVPSGEAEAVAGALQRLLADAELRRSLGQAGRQKALRQFTLDAMLRSTQAVYEELLARQGFSSAA